LGNLACRDFYFIQAGDKRVKRGGFFIGEIRGHLKQKSFHILMAARTEEIDTIYLVLIKEEGIDFQG